MIKKQNIVTGIDVGSSKISGVVASVEPGGAVNVIAHTIQPSAGVSRGVIVNMNEATRSVVKVVSKLRSAAQNKMGDVYVNINAENITGVVSKGMIPISMRGREVTLADIQKCVNAAGTIHLPFDREVIHRIVHNFSVDEQAWIDDPIGLYASRLYCQVYVITADVNHIQNLCKCVNDAGLDVAETVFTGVADASGVLSAGDKNSGTFLVDIGDSLTALSLFDRGRLQSIEVLPVGGRDIVGDLKDDPSLERISRSIRDSLEKISGAAAGGPRPVALVGGIAFADGFIETLEGKLNRPVKMGIAKDIKGDISTLDSARLVTALGLAKYASEKHDQKLRESSGMVKSISRKVVEIFNSYF